MVPTPPAVLERLTCNVETAAALLGISRALAYQLVRSGEIPSLKLGRRVVVPRSALAELLDIHPGERAPSNETPAVRDGDAQPPRRGPSSPSAKPGRDLGEIDQVHPNGDREVDPMRTYASTSRSAHTPLSGRR